MKNSFTVESIQKTTLKRYILIRGLKRAKNGRTFDVVAEVELEGNSFESFVEKKISEMALTEGVELVSVNREIYRVDLDSEGIDEGYQE